jgi:hypothetical protein
MKLGPEFERTLVCKLIVICSTGSHIFLSYRLYDRPNDYVWDLLCCVQEGINIAVNMLLSYCGVHRTSLFCCGVTAKIRPRQHTNTHTHTHTHTHTYTCTHTHTHAHKAKICDSIGIQIRDFSKRAVQDPRLRPHGQRDRRRA